MPFLLDTSTCIAAMRRNLKVVQRLQAAGPRDCAVSTVTTYELLTGVAKCNDPPKELVKVQLLLATIVEIPFDRAAAAEAAQVRATLESQGLTIGSYDLLLAGCALAENLTLVTSNVAEFSRVPNLRVEDWQA